jgi:hypothetical protein
MAALRVSPRVRFFSVSPFNRSKLHSPQVFATPPEFWIAIGMNSRRKKKFLGQNSLARGGAL